MIVASSDKEWLQRPIEILVLETVLSHLLRGLLLILLLGIKLTLVNQ